MKKMLLSVICMLGLSIAGCMNCVDLAYRDGLKAAAQGPTRIQCYEVFFAIPPYTSHCEAQVLVDGKWKYYNGGDLSNEAERLRRHRETCFELDTFRKTLWAQYNEGEYPRFNWQVNCADKWPEETTLDKVPVWVIIMAILLL